MFSSATQPPPPTRPPRHNFVVSAITFEGFKLRSSNLTHALFIQISRTSSITDIVVQSNMANRSEMARNAIESDFWTIKFCIDLKWPELRSKVNLGNPKWPIDLKWPEIRSKVNFGHPK